ncbi:hypothetical protein OH768_05865 [Streptomyces sp. NBC_01622]|nr:hypothetical protein OH768_05865 [Streptomyces sp. NBC_01622]
MGAVRWTVVPFPEGVCGPRDFADMMRDPRGSASTNEILARAGLTRGAL